MVRFAEVWKNASLIHIGRLCLDSDLVLYVLKSLADLSLDLVAEFDVVSEEVLDSLSSLGEFAFAVTEP